MLHITVVFFLGEEVKKKWRNLRDTYIKYLRNVRRTKSQQNVKRWQWAIQMSVFAKYIVRQKSPRMLPDADTSGRETPDIFMELEETDFAEDPIGDITEYEDNFSIQDESQNNDVDNKDSLYEILQVHSASTTTPPYQARKRKSSTNKDGVSDFIHGETYQAKPIKLDSIDQLFLVYASTVKSFSPKRQAIAKLKIAEAISQQELCHLSEQEVKKQMEDNEISN